MKNTSKPELLAPAGSLEAFFAAMESGADAVYAGLQDFSARAKAKNFSLSDLERMLAYAHERDRRIYVTLNTLVKEPELPQLVETLSALEAIGADAVIIQDMAVWKLVRDHFPGVRLHASTQMTIHNSAGIRMLESLGFKRAVLARELTLEEIAAIREKTTLELEHFVHGALCFSFSGQCYFSSFLGGKSGNRGRCAQPCRRRYRHRHDQGYYFSTNDLSAIDLLEPLTAAGIGSFKIEGRMKSAEYVANVVSAYRRVIDAPPKKKNEAVREVKEQLKDSFGRPPTRGFLSGATPTDIAVPSVHGATGRFLGKIDRTQGNHITFRTGAPLHVGDRVRIQPQTDQAGRAFTLKELRRGPKKTSRVDAGETVTVVSPFRDAGERGDAVFKVSSSQAFSMSDAACRRLLSTAGRAIRIDLFAEMPDNASLELTATSGGAAVRQRYPVEAVPATNRPLDGDILRSVFARGGADGIELAELKTSRLPPVVIPPSRMKEIRRDFYRRVREQLATARKGLVARRRDEALAALLPPVSRPGTERPELTVILRSIAEARLIEDRQVDRIVAPLEPGVETRLGKLPQRIRRDRGRLVWDIPFILFDRDWGAYADTIERLIGDGWTGFRLNNLSHFAFFTGTGPARLICGYRLFSLNTQAILAWKQLGAAEITCYIEDDRENLLAILGRETGVPGNLIVHAQVPLMTTRVPMPRVRTDTSLVSGRDEHYRVRRERGISTIAADTDFSLIGHLHALRPALPAGVTIDLSHRSAFSSEGKQILGAFASDRVPENSSPFNFVHGLE